MRASIRRSRRGDRSLSQVAERCTVAPGRRIARPHRLRRGHPPDARSVRDLVPSGLVRACALGSCMRTRISSPSSSSSRAARQHDRITMDEQLAKPAPRNILTVDDVLTAAAHFVGVKRRLRERFPTMGRQHLSDALYARRACRDSSRSRARRLASLATSDPKTRILVEGRRPTSQFCALAPSTTRCDVALRGRKWRTGHAATDAPTWAPPRHEHGCIS